MIVIIWTVAAFGAAYVLGHSIATQRLREILYGPVDRDGDGEVSEPIPPRSTLRRIPVMLLECPACLGFWLGLGAGFFICGSNPDAVIILISAFYTAGSNFILAKLTKLT